MTISRKTTAARLPGKPKPSGRPRLAPLLRGMRAHWWLPILGVAVVLLAAEFAQVPWPYLAGFLGLFVFAVIAVLGSASKTLPAKPARASDDPMRGFAGGLIVVGLIIIPLFGFVAGVVIIGFGILLLAIRRPASKGKSCPSCAELIRPEASVCRYCGRAVNTAAGSV